MRLLRESKGREESPGGKRSLFKKLNNQGKGEPGDNSFKDVQGICSFIGGVSSMEIRTEK